MSRLSGNILLIGLLLGAIVGATSARADCAQELEKVDQALAQVNLTSEQNNQIDALQATANRALEQGNESACNLAATQMKKILNIR